MTEYIIIGVDPGTTNAVAAINLKKQLIAVKSKKGWSPNELIEYVFSIGTPAIVACDVGYPQRLAQTLATKYGAPLIHPAKSLQIDWKNKVTRDYELTDSHQRDALAAALYAYTQVEAKLRKMQSEQLSPTIQYLVLGGNSIAAAKIMCAPKKTEPKTEKNKKLIPKINMINTLKKQINNLQTLISERDTHYQKILRKKNDEIKKLKKQKTNVVKPDTHIKTLQSKTARFEGKSRLFDRLSSGEIVLVGVYPKIISGCTLIEHSIESSIDFDVAFTSKKKVREKLINDGVKVIDSKHLKNDFGIYYIPARNLAELIAQEPAVEDIILDYKKNRGNSPLTLK